jgi:hypothetical protein
MRDVVGAGQKSMPHQRFKGPVQVEDVGPVKLEPMVRISLAVLKTTLSNVESV